MILHSLHHAGTHAFPDEITIDFDALPPLVAVFGPNGAGKTTAMDLVMAALVGEMPYRPGALYRNFATKGVIELRWEVSGRIYDSLMRVDPDAQRTEATLMHAGAVIAGPLIRDYRRAVAEIVGPTEVLLAAMYSVQSGAGAFIRLPRPERKALLSDLLGLNVFTGYHEKAKSRVTATQGELSVLRARITDLEARAAERAAVETKHRELRASLAGAQDAVTAAEAALAETSTAAVAAREARVALEPLRAEVQRLERELAELAARRHDVGTRRANNQALLGRAAEIRVAVARSLALQAQVEALDGQLTAARASYQAALQAATSATLARQAALTKVRTLTADRDRYAHQAITLKSVPCGGAKKFSVCQFIKDAVAAEDGLPTVEAELHAAAVAVQECPEPATPADPTAAMQAQRTTLQAEAKRLAPTVTAAAQLDVAEARIEELGAQVRQIAADVDEKNARRAELLDQLALLPALQEQELAAQRAANEADRRRRDAQLSVQSITFQAGQLEARLQALDAADVELADMRTREVPVAVDLADWNLLARAFSSSGIPALLIDQALPELGRLASELLRECYGESVFTIALTTQKENAAGDRLLETLDVIVSRGGEPIDAALLSGGESVLVSEALSLALALYSAGRSGRRIQTLMRDEVGAALDVDRAPAYTRMLRRAVQLGGFRHVLYVSHQPACLELADARLHVRGGKVTVE